MKNWFHCQNRYTLHFIFMHMFNTYHVTKVYSVTKMLQRLREYLVKLSVHDHFFWWKILDLERHVWPSVNVSKNPDSNAVWKVAWLISTLFRLAQARSNKRGACVSLAQSVLLKSQFWKICKQCVENSNEHQVLIFFEGFRFRRMDLKIHEVSL